MILDTPGLNAIGTEPELTLNLLPNAHAVLFVLAADAGVTKTDLEVWKRDLAGDDPAQKAGADRGPEQDRRPVGRAQARGRGRRRDRPPGRGVGGAARTSAGAGVRRVGAERRCSRRSTATTRCSRRSRLPALEDALSRKLIPAKRDIVGAATQAEVRALAAGVRAMLDARQSEHRRAARRAARAARQEPGRRRAHDGARAPRRRSSSSAACSASPRCAPCSRSRRTSCSTSSASRRCARTPGARAAASSAARSPRACAAR